MKQHNFFRLLFALFSGISIILSLSHCEKDENSSETNISKHGETESHNLGENCMACHKSGGEGEGWFTAAGTINGSPGDGFVYFYSDTTVAPVKTIEIDGNGNFYTTEDLDFSNGLFVKIESATGVVKNMPLKLFSGACNNCHSSSAPVLSL